MSDADVVVVGGGVIGCAVARDLAADHEVVLLERDQIAGEASALAAGEITMSPSYTEHTEVAEHANAFFREYDGTGQFHFEERRSLELVRAGRGAPARRRAERLAAAGVRVDYLDAATVEARFSRLDMSDYDGAIRHLDTGFVDPYTFTVTLKEDAEDRDATVRTGTAVADLLVADGAVEGVRTEDGGAVRAPHVVVAAGWRTEAFLRPHLQVPVQPYRTQCVVLEPDEPVGGEFPMGWVPGEHVYFRPELNGDLLLGGFSFAEPDPEGAATSQDEAFTHHVAALVPRFLEGFEHAGVVNGWAGVDGATPDTRPIVDAPAAGPEGLVVATGFHGRGVMTAPVAATLVREHLAGEPSGLPTELFALSRFESTSPDFEFRSISAGSDDYDDDYEPTYEEP